jgi:23S rRNA pseudouridine2605 synthase
MINNSRKSSSSDKRTVRLNKVIADAGITSRRKADELISSGSVSVNGKIITELGTQIYTTDRIAINGDQISREHHDKYILLNKPKNCITTVSDEAGRFTVLDIVKSNARIYPVGRLDRNTTGVLLLTNDGELANRMMHPKYGIERMYKVKLDRKLAVEDARKISKGVDLEEFSTSPCEVVIDPKDSTIAVLRLIEGKNREVRRIFEELDYEVKSLDRKFYANLSTTGLKRGEYRHLTRNEILGLKKIVGM